METMTRRSLFLFPVLAAFSPASGFRHLDLVITADPVTEKRAPCTWCGAPVVEDEHGNDVCTGCEWWDYMPTRQEWDNCPRRSGDWRPAEKRKRGPQ